MGFGTDKRNVFKVKRLYSVGRLIYDFV
jgi:hypothetical protein